MTDGMGVPGRDGAAVGVQGSDTVAGLAADRGEVPADVDARVRDGEGGDTAGRVGVPGGGEAGARIQSGDVVAGLAADGFEVPAGVDGRA